jgi:pimeloyl-ACP methyl ester carboxylesterase
MRFVRFALVLNLILSSLFAFGWALLSASPAEAASAAYGSCQSVHLPVALTPGQPASQTISATYCQPLAWASGPHEADVMTPGATYNSAYWDWPQDPALYSYVDKTLQTGRATFDYDRVGTGKSSHPPSDQITINNEAYVLHQIVSWLHSSANYGQVNLIGHSLGSVISIQEAGIYQDVSRVVVTGLLHLPNVGVGFAQTLLSLMHLAVLDPEFVGQRIAPGYMTTIPGDRAKDFYSSSADPAVITYDEAHKDIVPLSDLAGLATTWALPAGPNAADSITVPVLVVIGQQDAIFCADPPILDCAIPATVLASELPFYTAAPSLTVDTIAGAGHDIALHPSADQSFAEINQWMTTH